MKRRDYSALLGGLILVAAAANALAAPERSVLYPRGVPALRFSHAKHAKVGCNRCHGDVGRSISANDRHVPTEATCRPCHQKSTRATDTAPRGRVSDAGRCRRCHLGYSGAGSPPKLTSPAARIRFSHRLHHARGVDCASCHRFGGGAAESALPGMLQCMSCHRRRKVTNRCATCHLTQKDGRLQTRFGEQRLQPRGTLKGDAHTLLFAQKHASLARANRAYCETCHRPESCLSCHAGRFKPLRIHRSDYVSQHALDARRDQPRCVSCHRVQSFCLSCHLRSGVGQGAENSGFRPNTGVAFHPPEFNTPRAGPGHHKFSARRNVTACAGCHSENTCISCHGTRARRGGGFSPHGPGFATSRKCRSLANRNQRVCLKCHVGSDAQLRCR